MVQNHRPTEAKPAARRTQGEAEHVPWRRSQQIPTDSEDASTYPSPNWLNVLSEKECFDPVIRKEIAEREATCLETLQTDGRAGEKPMERSGLEPIDPRNNATAGLSELRKDKERLRAENEMLRLRLENEQRITELQSQLQPKGEESTNDQSTANAEGSLHDFILEGIRNQVQPAFKTHHGEFRNSQRKSRPRSLDTRALSRRRDRSFEPMFRGRHSRRKYVDTPYPGRRFDESLTDDLDEEETNRGRRGYNRNHDQIAKLQSVLDIIIDSCVVLHSEDEDFLKEMILWIQYVARQAESKTVDEIRALRKKYEGAEYSDDDETETFGGSDTEEYDGERERIFPNTSQRMMSQYDIRHRETLANRFRGGRSVDAQY